MIYAAAAACLLAAQEPAPAPPTVARMSVVNDASHMPPALAGGGIARGSLFRLQGWRLGPDHAVTAPDAPLKPTLAGVSIALESGSGDVHALPVMVSDTEIRALMPADAPLGSLQLRVSRDGSVARQAAAVNVVDASFGAYSRNHRGWGPGEITNADGQPNTLDHAARPGEVVRLSGTGSGGRTPQVLVAEREAAHVAAAPVAGRPGVDEIRFQLPPDTPEGCYVPVRVGASPTTVSNTVTLAVSGHGGACPNAGNWIAAQARQPGTLAIITLMRVALRVVISAHDQTDFTMETGDARFLAHAAATGANPLYMLPPAGSCVTLQGPESPRSIGGLLDAASGPMLDAGDAVLIRGSLGDRELKHVAAHRKYSALLGGQSPIGSAAKLPLFLAPGDYEIAVAAGPEAGPLRTHVNVVKPIEWTDRDQISAVDRSRGVSVAWRGGRQDGLVLVVAMNALPASSAMGVSSCVERSSAGQFHIPPEALANVPPGGESDQGLPLNLLGLIEIPASGGQTVNARGIDRVVSFYTSISARNVTFN